MPFASLLFAIILFFMSNKWFSAERGLSILLLLPIMLTTVIPNISEQINLYKKPTDSLIRSYFESFEISQPKVLDLSDPLITYHDQNKTLLLNVKLDPALFKYKMDTWKERNPETEDDAFAKYTMNTLHLNFISRAKGINEFTLRPDQLIVHGYWGSEFLIEVHYTKIKGEYVVTAPFPELKLIEDNNEGFLLYESDGNLKKLKIYDREGTSTHIEIDLSVE